MSHSRPRLVLLLAVFLAAMALRGAWLESTPPWWDEFVTLSRAKLPPAELWRSLSFQGPSDASLDSSPPLLHLILHPVLALGGWSATWTKLPSVLFGVLTVLVLFPLGQRLGGGRSGLYASALLALSAYHVHYSREVRPYALYLLLATASLWLLLRALENNRSRDWLLWCLCLAGTLYASYLGAASLAAQGAWLGGLALVRRLAPGRLLPACLGLAGAALLYLPWLPGHLFHMALIHSPGEGMGLTPEVLSRALMEYASGSALTLACAALGLVTAFRRGASAAWLLVLWAGLPMLAALALRTGIAVNPRYLMNAVPAMALAAGMGLDALVRGLSLALPGRAAALLGLVAAVGLAWPGLAGLPDYYRREQRGLREDMLRLAETTAGVDALAFPRNRHLKVFARWYLPGLYGDLASSGDLAYRRALLLAGEDFQPDLPGPRQRFGSLTGIRQGLLNLSPLPAAGPWRADFADLSFHRQAASWRNLAPDLFQKTLSLYDPERPGRAVWRFTAPPGGFAGDVPLRLKLRLTRSRATPLPDASLAVLAGSSPESLTLLARATAEDFPGGRAFAPGSVPGGPGAKASGQTPASPPAPDGPANQAELELSLTIPRPVGPELAVAVDFDPGTIHGSIDLAALGLDFPASPQAAQAWRPDLSGRAVVAPWVAGQRRTGDHALHAFAPGGPELAAFLAENPGASPVAELPGLLLFDPDLADPWLDSGRAGEVLFAPGQAKGLRMSGPLQGQAVSLGSVSVLLPEAPGQALYALAPGGGGRLRAELEFSGGTGQAFLEFNAQAVPEGPYLTCRGENSCFAVYRLSSAAPMRSLRLVYVPEAYGEPGQDNGVAVSLSTDGNTYRPLDSFTVRGTELWQGKKRRVVRLDLDKPAHTLSLRFELTSDKVRLWAGGAHPLRIDAWLDPAPVPPLDLGAPFRPESSGPAVRFSPSSTPLPDLDRLLAPY